MLILNKVMTNDYVIGLFQQFNTISIDDDLMLFQKNGIHLNERLLIMITQSQNTSRMALIMGTCAPKQGRITVTIIITRHAECLIDNLPK